MHKRLLPVSAAKKLKSSSRQVVFIPTDENSTRMSLPLQVIKEQCTDDDTENVWMTNIVDRYKVRPLLPIFTDMCLAKFASEYRVIYSETSPNNPNVFHLQSNMGVIQKRTRSSPAVIRYAKFSVTRDAEIYYKTILKLYLPFRKENQLKPKDFETFEMFFRSGHVKLSDENVLHKVCDIVNANKQHFEKNSNEIEHAMNEYERIGPVFDAWSEIQK